MLLVMTSRKRGRDPPVRYVVGAPPSKMGRGEFSDLEDALLLGALLKNGPLNTAKLVEAVPTRNEYQIKHRIAALQKKAQLSLVSVRKEAKNGTVKYVPRERVALDQWIDHLLELQDKAQIVNGNQEELPVRMLARAFGLIAEYEEHPNPMECGGVNLKNIYEFLETMMMGLPSKDLNNADARFLIESLQRLSSVLDSEDIEGEKSFVMCGKTQWRSKGARPRTYSKAPATISCDLLDETLQFLDTDKYNPFQVPLEKLHKIIDLQKSDK